MQNFKEFSLVLWIYIFVRVCDSANFHLYCIKSRFLFTKSLEIEQTNANGDVQYRTELLTKGTKGEGGTEFLYLISANIHTSNIMLCAQARI